MAQIMVANGTDMGVSGNQGTEPAVQGHRIKALKIHRL